jgi:hypothetical protein
MKTKLAAGLITLVIALGAGGYWYFQKTTPVVPTATSQETIPAVATTTKNSASDWKTYVNSQHGYTISYPPNTSIAFVGRGDGELLENLTSSTARWYASSVIILSDTNRTWFIEVMYDVNHSTKPCSAEQELFKKEMEQLGATQTSFDTFNLNGLQIFAVNSPGGFSFCLGSSSPFLGVQYGTDSSDISGQQGNLSEQDYRSRLNSMHDILSTLKLDPNFTPSIP